MKKFLHTGMFLFLTIMSFYSCERKGKTNILYYDDGVVKELLLKKPNGGETFFKFYESGIVKSIYNFDANDLLQGEQLYFYPSGILNKKIMYSNNIEKGNAFYFYDNTGTLESFKYFRDGKQVLYGAEYYNDSIGLMKSTLHFNDKGELYYRKNFDVDGNVLGEEGTK